MEILMNNELTMLREGLAGQRPVDEEVLTAAAVLSDRLEILKRRSPMFEAVSFSPNIEAMLAEQLTAVAN